MRSASSIVRRSVILSTLVVAPALAAADSGAQGAAPCAPGSPTPTVTALDQQAGAGNPLTATHSIQLDAEFADGSSPQELQISAPPGVHVDRSTLVSDTPGPLPITLSWTVFPTGADECTASMTTTLELQAPLPLKFGKLPRSLRPKLIRFQRKYFFSSGWALTALIGRYTDLRPVELRFRGVARTRLPSASMPFKTVTVSLRNLEPGLGRQRYLRSPKWQVTARTNYRQTAFSLEAGVKTGSHRDHPVAYELQALQAGRLMIRVRQAGKCNFGGCTWRTMKVEPGA